MKNKKGFTMVELLAVITIMGILSSVVTAGVIQYLNKAKKQDFAILEKNMKTALDNYFIEHSGELPAIGDSKTVDAQTLMNEGYLDSFEDPDRGGSACNLTSSYAKVTRAGSSSDFNMTLNYKICVVCSKLKSSDC